MYQYDDATVAAVLPTPSALGTTGYFTDGVPGVTAATILRADYMNMMMMELMNIVTAASLTPSKTTYNQLLLALRSAGVFTTQAINDSSTKAATTAFANPAVSIGANGYVKLPSGIIIQWGTATGSSSAAQSVTLPTTYGTAHRVTLITPAVLSGALFSPCESQTTSTFTFSVWNTSGSRTTTAVDWLSLGN